MLAKIKALLGLSQTSESKDIALLSPKPTHVAVIMDGNGRWANSQGLTRVAGHKRGADAVKGVIKHCIEYEIPVLSLFAFSSENWNRPQAEVDALMDLLANALETQTKKLDENQISLRLIGDLSRFNSRIQKLADNALAETRDHSKLLLNIAINYGGRWDITQAAQRVAEKVKSGELEPNEIDESVLSSHLSTAELSDPDLFIRTSGEYRISNFMLWQAAYAEFYFTDTLWPDFDREEFNKALRNFATRDRRFGDARDPSNITDKSATAVDNKKKAEHA